MGYIALHDHAAGSRGLPLGARLLHGIISGYCAMRGDGEGYCSVSNRRLAERMAGAGGPPPSARTVQRHLALLKAEGLVAVGHGHGGARRLTLPPHDKDVAPRDGKPSLPATGMSPPHEKDVAPRDGKPSPPHDKDVAPHDKDVAPHDGKPSPPHDKDVAPRDKNVTPHDKNVTRILERILERKEHMNKKDIYPDGHQMGMPWHGWRPSFSCGLRGRDASVPLSGLHGWTQSPVADPPMRLAYAEAPAHPIHQASIGPTRKTSEAPALISIIIHDTDNNPDEAKPRPRPKPKPRPKPGGGVCGIPCAAEVAEAFEAAWALPGHVREAKRAAAAHFIKITAKGGHEAVQARWRAYLDSCAKEGREPSYVKRFRTWLAGESFEPSDAEAPSSPAAPAPAAGDGPAMLGVRPPRPDSPPGAPVYPEPYMPAGGKWRPVQAPDGRTGYMYVLPYVGGDGCWHDAENRPEPRGEDYPFRVGRLYDPRLWHAEHDAVPERLVRWMERNGVSLPPYICDQPMPEENCDWEFLFSRGSWTLELDKAKP